MEFQLNYFKSYKMMLWKCCTQYATKFGKLGSGHRTGKGQFSLTFTIPKEGNAKECSNYCTVMLISHASKVMLKILQDRLQQYMDWEHPGVQTGFRKRWRHQRSNCQQSLDHGESKEIPEKTSVSFTLKPLTCVDHNKLWKILQEMGIPDHLICLLRNLYAGLETTNQTWNKKLVQNWERSRTKLYIFTWLI